MKGYEKIPFSEKMLKVTLELVLKDGRLDEYPLQSMSDKDERCFVVKIRWATLAE